MRRFVFNAVLVAGVVTPCCCRAADTSLVASKDNSIFANNTSNSNGGGAGIFVGTTNMMQNDSLRRGLLEFDIASGVPAGATITDVTLTMYLGQASAASGVQTIDLHRLTADWGEGTAGNYTTSISGTGTGTPASAGDATWSQRFYQQTNWTAPGAGGDFASEISASADVAATVDTPYQWQSTATLVSDVQGWLDDPATNDGWILVNRLENVQQTVKAFYSRDAVQKNGGPGDPLPPEWRPTLNISYTSGDQPNGDYNGNEVVDAADYIVWRNSLGTSVSSVGSGADGNQNGTIDVGDFTFWRARFGNATNQPAAGVTVPEPTTIAACLIACTLAYLPRRR